MVVEEDRVGLKQVLVFLVDLVVDNHMVLVHKVMDITHQHHYQL
jgi:hypothetical protein